jgi:N4-gp56 family major capsid protein
MEFLKKLFAMFMADTALNVNDTADLDLTIPEHWDTKIRRDAERKSFWDKFEGSEGSNSAIIVRNDFEAKAGDVVHVNVHSNLEGAGVSGETELKGKEEKLSFSQFNLRVDWLRHAVGFNKRGTKRSLLNAMSVANSTLSTWLAKRKDDDLFAQLLDLADQRHIALADTATNTVLYPNAVVAVSGITNADSFGVAEITKMKTALNRKLSDPIETMMDGKQLICYYGIVLDDIAAEYYLKSDPVWQQAQREAGLRGDTNKLFNGAFGSWNSCVIYSFQGKVGQGSFLRPEAITSATSLANAEVLFAAATGRRPYQQYFVNGHTKYQAVEASGTDNSITMDAGAITSRIDAEAEIAKQYRLVAHTHAEFTGAGTIITQENHYASAIGFGSEIAARIWGMQPKPISDVRDYGFQYGVGIEAVYGCKVIEDLATNSKNHVVLRHYCKNPYLGI